MASNINETTGTDDNIDPAVQQSAVNNTANINETTGTADDDGGTQPNGPTPSNNNSSPIGITNTNQSSVGTNGTTGGTNNVSQGATGSPTSNANTFSANSPKPGKRLKNPLGYLDSYTYQLSLYMITPDAYNAFIQSGRKNVEIFNGNGDAGAYLLAQSGGINNTTSKRAPGFELDLYIDSLNFQTITNSRAEGSNTNATEFTFKIIEPYGFSFTTKLRKANDALATYSKAVGWPDNPLKQTYILGICFYGYDSKGNVVTGKEVYDNQTLDPNASGNGSLFQQYYDILISGLTFKLDGKATTYEITANSTAPKLAHSVNRGIINTDIPITATTVGDAITQVFDHLNQEEIKKSGPNNSQLFPNRWKLDAYVNAQTNLLNAAMVTKEDIDKIRWPGSGAKNSQQVNDATALLNSQPSKTAYSTTFKQGTPLVQILNDIVKQSTFLRDALKAVYTQSLEPTDKGLPINKPNTNKNIEWFNISTEISDAKWDGKVNDWAITTTFILQTYQTPVVESPYANSATTYYGPYKRYGYYFTGENREILHYQQSFDANYYTVVAGNVPNAFPGGDVTNTGNNANSPAEVAIKPGQYTNQPRMGELGQSQQAQNSYLTSLYDPGAFAEAEMTILGDPDFLITDQATSEDKNVYGKFYGTDGFTINPNAGQVFIEVDFKEAIDYDYNKGLLNINESIYFYNYPDSIKKLVKGVSYQVNTADSHFSDGKFTQTLHLILNTFAAVASTDQRTTTPDTQTPGPNKGDAAATTDSQGLTPANPPNQNANPQTNPSGNNPATQPTGTANPQTNVQDDDNISTTTVTITESGGGSTTRYANGAVVISSA